ncbi:MAG TPA: hypothetical protein VMT24_04970 [Aggregatilineaceae bacterium]|nr:hypothetical protein [Aggregatilineaceae bacterium]
MSNATQAEPPDTLSLTSEYSTPYSALIRDDVVMGVPRYFLERWVPVLGVAPATVINTLRQLDYRCHGEAITISGEALAREAAMSRRYLYTCLETPWLSAFLRLEPGQRVRAATGKIVQETNRYTVRMDDPLTPADADHLLTVLTKLSDTPLGAANRALTLEPRDLWASDPTHPSEHFTTPRAITAPDVLQRAFPTWNPADDTQRQEMVQVAEALHRHITLVREDGKTSKVIVPQYFRKRWWKRLGHDLAWTYIWLRGYVYDNPEEGIRRDTCWIPALNTLLALIGRPREWWRRNVENATAQPEDWSINDFFRQIDARKGRDPSHPQWVARQFFVALEIPIAPEDRPRYADLLHAWQGQGIAPQPLHAQPDTLGTSDKTGSAPSMHNGIEDVRPSYAHRFLEGLQHTDTPGNRESATSVHIGIEGVRHTRTQTSATPVHRESESSAQAPPKNPSISGNTKHPHPPPVTAPEPPDAAAAEYAEIPHNSELSLIDQIAEGLNRTPEAPLYGVVDIRIWLQQAWPEPVRPHTPAWTMATSGQMAPRDLLALILAIWADASIQHPPRYLSWLVQRWQTLPEVPPVDRWDHWRALADMPLIGWMQKGRREWAELAPRDNRALPFGLDALVAEFKGEREINGEQPPPQVYEPEPPPPKSALPEPDGLDERPGGGTLTVRDIWRATLGQLSLQLNRSTYTNWVEGTKPVSYADGVLTVRARHIMARHILAERLHQSIESTASSLAQMPITIRYTVDAPPLPVQAGEPE